MTVSLDGAPERLPRLGPLRLRNALLPLPPELLDRPDAPSLGVGECVAGPVAAAIANAFAAAYGVRLRDLPLTRERVLAALQD